MERTKKGEILLMGHLRVLKRVNGILSSIIGIFNIWNKIQKRGKIFRSTINTIFLIFLFILTGCSTTESEAQEKCGRNAYEFIAFNPGVGVCQTYSKFPINSSSYSEQLNYCILYTLSWYICGQKKSKLMEINLNPFLSQKRKDEEEEDGRILGWYLLDQGIKRYNSTK
jgi:hypothetical protein